MVEVGTRLPELALPPVNRATLALFAGASGDHNPIHIDLDFARRAGMPDVFAHGMLVKAWLARLLTQWVPQQRIKKLSVRFLGMTQVGDVIRCFGEVVELSGGCARVHLEAKTQHGVVRVSGEALIAIEES